MQTSHTDKGDETRARILAAARELFAERGYEATSMSAIMAACDLTKGGVYFHFPSKAALAVAVLQEGKAAIDAAINADVRGVRAIDDLFAMGRGAFRVCASSDMSVMKRLARELEADPETSDALENVAARWAGILHGVVLRAQEQGDVAAHIDVRAVSVLIAAAFFGLTDMGDAIPGGPPTYQHAYIAMCGALLELPPDLLSRIMQPDRTVGN